MLCTIDGFDRVPDTAVLLKSEDYQKFIKLLDKAVDVDLEACIEIDPDDCGDCCETISSFAQYNISATPIRKETYADIHKVYEETHFGFNYVLDAVLDAIYNVLEDKLTIDEIAWLVARSESVKWAVEEKEKNKAKTKKLDKQTAQFIANDISNCGNEVADIVSENFVDMSSLKQKIEELSIFTKKLKDIYDKAIENYSH